MLANLQPTSFPADSLEIAEPVAARSATPSKGRVANDASPPAGATAAGGGESPLFTPLELLVIGIGERDPLVELTSGRWARLRRTLFGIEVPRPFADPRLEALRMLAIALRRRRTPDAGRFDQRGARGGGDAPADRTSPLIPTTRPGRLDMDEAYYIARMRASLAMAHNAAGSAARLIHFDLAGRYSVAAAMAASDSLRIRCGTIRPAPTSFRINDNHPPAPMRLVACCVATG